MTEAILARSGRDSTRLAAGWLRLAVASLMLAGFTAILVALARTPGLQALVGPQGFRLFLVGHVNFSLTVWCLGFISAAWAWLATREGYGVPDRLGKPGLALGAAGTLAMAIATILAQGRPLLVDYLPLITHPLFELGLIAFFGGTTLMALGFLAGTSWFPLTGPDRRSFPVQALRIAALAEIAAVIALLVAVTAGWRGDWQLAAWGGGHLLQVANASAMVGLWWYLAAGAEAPAPRWLSRTLPIYLLPCIGIPALYLMPGHTPVAIMRDLNWTAVAIPTTLAVGATFLRLWNTAPLGATHHAALTSLILFSLGLGMALMGLEGDTRVTAHYHGTVGAVTVAFMGLAFRFLPDLGLSLRFGRLSRLLPQMYGFGLMLLIAGLYWASMFGGQRKVFETFAHQQGLWGPLVPFGAGAVVTVIAGIAFIWVLGASAFGRPVAAAQLAVPAAEAAPPLAGPSPIPTDAAQVPGGLAPGGLAPSMARRIPQVLPALVLFCLAGLAGAPALAADRPAAPDFALSDQDGRLVRLSDLRGKPVVLTFLYTHCPDTCPRTLGHLLTALKDRPGDAAVVTVTVDPARDDKARLAEYAKQWPAGWRFLTGPEAQVGKVWAQYGVSVRRDEETGHHHHGHHMGYTITHSNVVLVLDAAGRITERISGAWSAADVSGALAQARQAEGIRWAAMPLQALRDFLDKCGAYATRNPVAFAGIVLLIALPGILLPLFLFRTFVLN